MWNFSRSGRTEPAESKKWTAGRKALALFPVRSAGPNSRWRSCASVEDGRPHCHIHRRGRGQIPFGRPPSRPYPADHSENPSQTRAVIGFAAPVTTGSRLLVTGAARLADGNPIRRNISVCLFRLLLAAIGSPDCSCGRSLCTDTGASTENHCNRVTGFSLDRTGSPPLPYPPSSDVEIRRRSLAQPSRSARA